VVLAQLDSVEMTFLVGKYAMDYHLKSKRSLTENVKLWKQFLPYIPLPHPSPRNNIWLKKNSWFEQEVLPEMRSYVHALWSKT
jgi:uracil-DNA glycosylase